MFWPASLAILVGSLEIRPLGGEETLPPLEPEERYVLVLQGTFEIEATGRRYDARRTTDGEGRFTERHGLVRIDPPGAARLVREDTKAHRYEYEVRAQPGTRLSAWVDLGRLQEDLLVSRGELAAGSKGAIWADLWVDEGWTWAGGGVTAGGAAAAVAALVFLLMRRRRPRREDGPSLSGAGDQ
jgi:hypothetical protein